ncbi:MAG: hypothetical protein ACK4GN_10855 [Runella sp.]
MTTNLISIRIFQILNWIFFGLMILVNYLANALPLNDKTTGALSAQYPNLFVPAPVTFSIWGVIYLLLLMFCIKQSKTTTNEDTTTVVASIGPRFVVTCLLNALWILTWHYEHVMFSVLVMLMLLAQLVELQLKIKALSMSLGKGWRAVLKSAFGLYLGWICVATIANITAALVHYRWSGWGQGEVFWACMMVWIGGVVAIISIQRLQNFFIGLSVIWAFMGIIFARFNAVVSHSIIMWNVGIMIFFVLLTLILRGRFQKKF